MVKIIFIGSALAAVVYTVLNLMGHGGFYVFYRVITIVAGTYAASRAFAKAAKLGDKDALFTGALGLGTLAVSEVYYSVHTVILRGTETDLSVKDYSYACSYLFFLAAVTLLLLPPIKWESTLRIGLGVISTAIMITTTYAIIKNDGNLLYITVIATAVICILLSVCLFYQAVRIKQLRTARTFACSMIFLGVLDVIIYLFLVLKAGSDWYNALASLYTPLYIWICESLLRLRNEDEQGAVHG